MENILEDFPERNSSTSNCMPNEFYDATSWKTYVISYTTSTTIILTENWADLVYSWVDFELQIGKYESFKFPSMVASNFVSKVWGSELNYHLSH